MHFQGSARARNRLRAVDDKTAAPDFSDDLSGELALVFNH